ncbi:MAG TPA: GNAT family N-acetyltransferase [Rhizomicrobium sp.]
MSDDTERHARLTHAANPRRATMDDARAVARLFAAAFATDPVMDYIARPGPKRAAGLENFFYWLLQRRAIPFGHVWMADDAGVAAAWLPPNAPATAGGFFDQLKLIPMFVRLCGFPRLTRGQAMGDAMEKTHPHDPHFYLAFIGVAPRFQGMGLGGAMMEATVKKVDEARAAAYLENSNPKNTKLYERAGFARRTNIAPKGAPPLIAMWRDAKA